MLRIKFEPTQSFSGTHPASHPGFDARQTLLKLIFLFAAVRML